LGVRGYNNTRESKLWQ